MKISLVAIILTLFTFNVYAERTGPVGTDCESKGECTAKNGKCIKCTAKDSKHKKASHVGASSQKACVAYGGC
ncbi:MAG: hypothetical protein EBY16_06615 [Gammaproteobacteria bacterium]|nr:hypothetical protein [Gammaproteobacteria bacterium]